MIVGIRAVLDIEFSDYSPIVYVSFRAVLPLFPRLARDSVFFSFASMMLTLSPKFLTPTSCLCIYTLSLAVLSLVNV